MPSRKKAKGKARKAAKEAKARAKEEESRAAVNVAANQQQEESLEIQMQQLRINTASPELCRHGLLPLSAGEEKICVDFINVFIAAYSEDNVGGAISTAYHATKVEYADVYDSKLDIVISILLSCGTKMILDGDNKPARMYACMASFFDEWMAVDVRKTQPTVNCTKIAELIDTDDHTLVSYHRKRISCACLDEKYEEVKSVKKMGLCHNTNCHSGGMVERRKMFSCTQCGYAHYCSVECQRADWNRHREDCKKTAEKKAAFNSNQT